MGRGLLHLTVLSASDLRKHDRFGKQQCYVEAQLGSGSSRTKTSRDGGPSPVWNETLFLQVGSEQNLTFRVLVEKLLVKDVEIGTATLSLDQVLLNGSDDAVLSLTYKGNQQGTLSVSLELRSSTPATHSRASSTSSLASPLSSASLAITHSGSFTGPTGLKPSSLPVMLMQTPNLALYREQLLQQSAMLAQQQQQAQAQQQQQRAASLARSSSGLASCSSGGSAAGRKVAWAPKKTAADLFADPSSVNSMTETPDLLGLFGDAATSSFSDYDSHFSQASNMPARQPVDAERVQALMNAVYGGAGGAGGPAVGSSSTPASPAAAGQSSSAVQPSASSAAAGMGGTRTSQPRAGQPRAGGAPSVSSSGVSSNASAQSSNRAGGSSRVQHAGDGMGYDPFGGAAYQAAAAVAVSSSPSSPPRAQQPASASDMQQHRGAAAGPSAANVAGSSRGTGRTAGAAAFGKDPVYAAAAAAEAMPDAFGAAAMQAAAAAFAAAGADPAWGGNSVSEQGSGEDPDAFLAGLAAGTSPQQAQGAAAAAGVRLTSTTGASSIPDPFATFGGMQAAAAAAAAVMQGADMPDPFGMTGYWHAAAAAGAAPRAEMPDPFGAGSTAAAAAAAAAAGSGGSGIPGSSMAAIPSASAAAAAAGTARAEQHAGHGGHRPPSRRLNAFQAPIHLSTVIECSESPGNSARLHMVGPAATGAAGHAKPVSAQLTGGGAAALQAAAQAGAARAGAAGGEQPSGGSPVQGPQLQEQLSQLAKQLQERDLLVQQLQEQLQQTQQQLQQMKGP